MNTLILGKIKNLKNRLFHIAKENTEKQVSLDDHIRNEIDRAKRLADTINTTTDEKEFFSLFDEITDILTDLTHYEGFMNFTSPPSKDLKRILENKEKSIELLHQRIKEESIDALSDAAQTAGATPEDDILKDSSGRAAQSTMQRWPEQIRIKFAGCIERELGYIEEELTIINTTTDEEELFRSLDKVSDMLNELTKLDYMPDHLLPSYETLRKIPENRKKFIRSFRQRVKTGIAPEAPMLPAQLEAEITQIHEDFDHMEGYDFEFFCAGLLEKNGFYNILVTSESSDQGLDIVAYKEDVKYGIQCKRHSSTIGNKAVQEAYAGATFYDCHVPVVLTNRYFTQSAMDLTDKTHVLLWDRDKLLMMIHNAKTLNEDHIS